MRICADATGLGAGVASWLASALGESAVERFVLTAPAKSKLGFDLLGMAGTGRCRVYGRDDAAESRQVWLEESTRRGTNWPPTSRCDSTCRRMRGTTTI